MNHEVKTQIEINDLTETEASADVGVELSDLELQAVAGGLKRSWSCGTPAKADEWD
ncbi:MAG: hypothetical protein ABW110_01840 [Steroidobacteraceae bacterium]